MREPIVKFKCNNCGHIGKFYCDDFDYEIITYEREMGVEREYYSNVDVGCNNCGNSIRIECNFWECPEGSINHKECNIDGYVKI